MTAASVLLVGDDEPLAAALADAGHGVTSVGSGQTALGRLEAADCVVATADLGSRTGFDLARAVSVRDELLPTVVVGAAAPAAVADEAVEPAVASYLQRPAPDEAPPELPTVVADAAGAYREHRTRRRAAHGAPVGTAVLRGGDVAYANPQFGDAFAVEEPEGATFADLVAEADRDPVRSAIRAASEDPDRLRCSPAAAPGRTLDVHVSRLDGTSLVCSVVDVSERAERVADLEEDSRMLDSLLENVPISIYFKDRQSRHERVSRYITKTDPGEFIRNDEGKVHPHPEDVVGKSDFDLYAPEFAADVVEDDRFVIEEGEAIVDRIEEGETNLGEALYTSTTKAPRYDEEGNVVGLVGVTVDVTDRIKHRQELERQNERLDEFSEVLTHDLRNPLQIAKGYLETELERRDSTELREAASALARMTDLIEEIRTFVLEGRTVEDPVAVALETAAEDAWSNVRTRGADLELDGELRLRADPGRLQRLLENLFRNAVEHGTTDAFVPADLTVRVVALEDGFVVEDDGEGLPEDAGDEVFRRGFTTSDDGTGFGLAIVRNIAEAHGWTVDAGESEEGGARFTFTDVVRAEEVLGQTLADAS